MSGGVAGDLAWWRSARGEAEPATMRAVLERLKAWKVQHDDERSRQPGFLGMAWDGVFGDEDEQVTAVIAELEEALARR